MNTPCIQARSSMDLSVRGSLQAMTATGTVTVPRLRVVIDKIPGTGPKDVQPWELTVEGVYGPGPGAVGAGDDGAAEPLQVDVPLPFLRADIRVDIPRNAWIHGPGTAMEMSGDLQITKELEQPFISAAALPWSAALPRAYGKRFVMKQGQVTFTGSPEINPFAGYHGHSHGLELPGDNSRRRQGSAAPDQLQQHARAAQSDILSLLIVGKTMDRLTSSEQAEPLQPTGGARREAWWRESCKRLLGGRLASIRSPSVRARTPAAPASASGST